MTRLANLRVRGSVATARFGGHGIPLRQSGSRPLRLPKSDRRNVEEWVTTIDRDDNAGSGWSPAPGNQVGVTPLGGDEDSAETLQSIDVDLKGLNRVATALVKQASRDFVELGL